ncbi:cobalt-precorrin-6A reductase [Acetobacter ascendens]|uniref:Cobalt-precorrin-6A reductase n=1 Tax=Acetobacter ascendens TaxID=481146 RepID=A0A1D8QVE6_9PROT|nr:cobalt-precorrin-6A reductase [Acetobacter ascendens]AOW46293.1 cobalt-precorrin-6A reductase [Acetobacter ascendens]
MPSSSNNFRVLVLGGTTEASALCRYLEQEPSISATLSLAGATKQPHLPTLSVRIGGFGGSDGLCAWLKTHGIKAIIDATHPFAATMSQHAATACATTQTPLLRLERSGWQEMPSDKWFHAANLTKAANLLANAPTWKTAPQRIFLTTGRKELAPFKIAPQHRYLIRSIDAPDPASLPPNATILLDRGPFDVQSEAKLMQDYDITLLVSKNSGGSATYPKLEAARLLHIPVLMVDRPVACSNIPIVETAQQAMAWLQAHQAASTRRKV